MNFIYDLDFYEPKTFADYYIASKSIRNEQTAKLEKVAFNKFLIDGYIVNVDYINNVKTNLEKTKNNNYVRTLTTIIKTYIKAINKRFSLNIPEWNITLPDKTDTIKKGLTIKELDQFFNILKDKANQELNFYISFLYTNQARSEEFFKVLEKDNFHYDNNTNSYATFEKAIKGGEYRFFVIPKEYANNFKEIYQNIKKGENSQEKLKTKMRMQLTRFVKTYIYTLPDWDKRSKITTHIFRHSKATNAFYLGVDPNKIGAALGHRPGSETVFNHYIKTDERYKLEAWKALNETKTISEKLEQSQSEHIKELTQTIEKFSLREAETLQANEYLKSEIDKMREERNEQKKQIKELFKLVEKLTNELENTTEYKTIKLKKQMTKIFNKTTEIKQKF